MLTGGIPLGPGTINHSAVLSNSTFKKARARTRANFKRDSRLEFSPHTSGSFKECLLLQQRGTTAPPSLPPADGGPLQCRFPKRIRSRAQDRTWYKEDQAVEASDDLRMKKFLDTLQRRRDMGWANEEDMAELRESRASTLANTSTIEHPASPDGYPMGSKRRLKRPGATCRVNFQQLITAPPAASALAGLQNVAPSRNHTMPMHGMRAGLNLPGAGSWVRYNMTR